jgi:hypothetical protein
MDEPKRGDVRESDGMVCWGYTWKDKDGNKLKQIDEDARVRALMRTRVLDQKNNNSYNPITGEDRFKINVPHHERYNPVLYHTGSQVVTAASRRSAASGIVPGLN